MTTPPDSSTSHLFARGEFILLPMFNLSSKTPIYPAAINHDYRIAPQNETNNNFCQPPIVVDTTGQIAPPGVKPCVTATLWEDEGTLCFQVYAKGICVARREDNHMINFTKLLSVARKTVTQRRRREQIWDSEKSWHVVPNGPMHLKGVWYVLDTWMKYCLMVVC
jgi:protein SOK2